MANEEKKDAPPKKVKPPRQPKFLVIGKYFLLLLILFGQGVLAYALVDKYYPTVYEKMHEKNPDDFGTYQMEELVINPANTNGKRYLLVEISLELKDKEHILQFEKNQMKLKQEIIESLSTRTIRELTQVEGREEIREDLIEIINSTIDIPTVRNLYFTKYVMQ